MNEKSLIVQSNYLIENRPKMTKNENRLFLSVIANINKDDGLKIYQISVKEFIDIWGMSEANAYNQIEKALESLSDRAFVLKDTVGENNKARFFKTHYLASAEYIDGQGYIEVEISEKFKPYLLELKEQYTKYLLENLVNLTGIHSIRTYELLKQYESIGIRKILVEEYKKSLGIEDKYKGNNADLKKRVLNPSKNEINANTDILIDYIIKGRGKKAEIEFNIKTKKGIASINVSKEKIKGSNKETEYIRLAEKVFQKYDTDKTAAEYIEWLKGVVDIEKAKKKAYFESCIKNEDNAENFLAQITMELEKKEKREKALEEAREIERLFKEGKLG